MNRQYNPTDNQFIEFNIRQQVEASFGNSLRDENQLPTPGDDDLLTSLCNAYENRRARQVFEWEAVRRRATANSNTRSFVS